MPNIPIISTLRRLFGGKNEAAEQTVPTVTPRMITPRAEGYPVQVRIPAAEEPSLSALHDYLDAHHVRYARIMEYGHPDPLYLLGSEEDAIVLRDGLRVVSSRERSAE